MEVPPAQSHTAAANCVIGAAFRNLTRGSVELTQRPGLPRDNSEGDAYWLGGIHFVHIAFVTADIEQI